MRAPGLKTQSYKTPNTSRRLLLCVLLGVLILYASTLVRQRLGIPLAFSLRPQATTVPENPAAPTEKPSYDACEISLAGRSWYALQLGAFTQENAAHQLSQEFIPRGAAGYIYAQEDIFRVYAAAYPTRAEAQSVQTRLSEQGVTTYIQPCNEPSFTLRATGTKAQLSAVQDIFTYLDALSMKFYTLSCQLDQGDLSVTEALSALASEGATCRALSEALSRTFPKAVPAAAKPVQALLDSLALACENGQNNQSAARAGAALKSCQLKTIAGLQELSHTLAQP